ncbi:hypothetical protein KCP69_07005 [Salmonella enterica subsp. enterica]|nr:hypothetical protein KCP69_07005 [Salmonella enterica subsp. enterica]
MPASHNHPEPALRHEHRDGAFFVDPSSSSPRHWLSLHRLQTIRHHALNMFHQTTTSSYDAWRPTLRMKSHRMRRFLMVISVMRHPSSVAEHRHRSSLSRVAGIPVRENHPGYQLTGISRIAAGRAFAIFPASHHLPTLRMVRHKISRHQATVMRKPASFQKIQRIRHNPNRENGIPQAYAKNVL